MKKKLFIVFTIIILLIGAYFLQIKPRMIDAKDPSIIDNATNTAETPTNKLLEGFDPSNSISAKEQFAGNTVTIIKANFKETGFIVIFSDINEKPDKIVGYSPLLKGNNENVRIRLNRSTKVGDYLHAQLHSDNGNGKLDYPGDDNPIQKNGKAVVDRFFISGYTDSTKANKIFTYEYDVTVEGSTYIPSAITVKKDQKVILNFISAEIQYDFLMPDFNINVVVPRGQNKRVEFTADKLGSFTFNCDRWCGEDYLTGEMIVK